jgi:phosphopantetheinyl transferase (holo-ACP synthase)
MIRIHNLETNEIIDREMTAAEFKEYEAQQANTQAREAEQAAKLAAKEAVLTKLGLTAEEAAALLG